MQSLTDVRSPQLEGWDDLLGGEGELDMLNADARYTLARALVESSAPMSDNTVRGIVFLRLYLGRHSSDILRDLLRFKVRQAPGMQKRMLEAIRAFSLEEFMGKQNIFGGRG
jgi:hypothetical protein